MNPLAGHVAKSVNARRENLRSITVRDRQETIESYGACMYMRWSFIHSYRITTKLKNICATHVLGM